MSVADSRSPKNTETVKAIHTPGPWRFQPDDALIVSRDGEPIARLFYATSPDPEDGGVNARLIAAAPELLEAFEVAAWARHNAHCYPSQPASIAGFEACPQVACLQAHRLLRKARGEDGAS